MTPAAMADLHSKCFETPRPWSAAEFADLLEGETVFLHVRDAGFVIGRAVAGEAELLTLAVDPARRRRGVGNELLKAFELAAEARSAQTAFLEVSVENVAALALYTANEYVGSGRRPNYYRTPDGRQIDAVVLAKTLASG